MGIPIYVTNDPPGPDRKYHTVWEYEGCVLADRERNMYHDSYFYAILWDDKEQSIREIEYGTTAAYAPTWCRVDATPEVIEKALNYLIDRNENLVREGLPAEIEDTWNTIEIGAYVEVVKGRKLPKGTKGYVSSVMSNAYSPSNRRVALQVGDEMAYTYEDNLKVLEPTHSVLEHVEWLQTPEALARMVKRAVAIDVATWQVEYRDTLNRLMKERFPALRRGEA